MVIVDDTSVLEFLGIPALRVEMLVELRRRGRASLPELATALGCTRNALTTMMSALEGLGLVTVASERTPTCCKPVRFYTVVPARWEEVAWALFDAFAGPEHHQAGV